MSRSVDEPELHCSTRREANGRWMDDGLPMFLNGDLAILVDTRRGVRMTSESQEATGPKRHQTLVDVQRHDDVDDS
ncbi:jg14923 [Pararge aegeria aegeria]|uniref:Jg14923 protein n=1 Tax=Pararge aegeria aegeria TaxID=348720 RepID=A0A8S4QKN3_9NEOP|nr:jg14923 [Pararge aegeria aegeria]